MKKKLFGKIMAVALSTVMAFSSMILVLAEEAIITASPSLELGKTEVNVNVDGTDSSTTVTAKNGSDAPVATSENPQIATALITTNSSKANVLQVKGLAPGVVKVKITYGDLKKEVKVTVKENFTKSTYKFYGSTSDVATTNTLTSQTVWSRGDKEHKTAKVYTNAIATTCDPNIEDAKITAKKGNVYAIVSNSSVTDVNDIISNNKPITDSEAAKILKAKYTVAKGTSYGTITLTAGDVPGIVKVWIVQIDAQNRIAGSASMTVTAKGSAQMMLLTADSLKNGDKVIPARELTEVTKVSIPVKKSSTYNLACFLKDGTTVADASSTYKISSDNESLLTAKFGEKTVGGQKVADYSKVVFTSPSSTATVGKAKVTITCNESGKKLTITVIVTNPVTGITSALESPTDTTDLKKDQKLWLKGDAVTLKITEKLGLPALKTTDTVKIYVSEVADYDSKNNVDGIKAPAYDSKAKKVVYTKSNAVTASYKNGILKIKRTDPFKGAEIWFAYTDSVTKQVDLFKACAVKPIVLTDSYISVVSGT